MANLQIHKILRSMKFMYALVVAIPMLIFWNNFSTNLGSNETQVAPSPLTPVNSLTEEEQKAGWKLLFDGKTMAGWHRYGNKPVGQSWKVEDGAMMFDPSVKDGGDIVTDGEFEDFDFRLEWKIAPCGNSGIMFYVVESDKYPTPWRTGPEMQVLDNACHPDAKIKTHRAGDLYDMIACSTETVKPAGEWNQVRIVSKNGRLQHWLNGKKVVETTLWDQAWYDMIAKSKFKDMADFGRAKKGKFSLQDHGDKVWFRNIKLKAL